MSVPSGILVAQSAGWLALVVALSFALALGISSLLGSRGTSVGILLGWWLVATPVLMNLEPLGSVREGLAVVALDGLAPAALFEAIPRCRCRLRPSRRASCVGSGAARARRLADPHPGRLNTPTGRRSRRETKAT